MSNRQDKSSVTPSVDENQTDDEAQSEVSMANLMRGVRMALRFKYSLILSFVCSVLVATLWAANITAVYPIVEVVFEERDIHDWVAAERAVSTDEIKKTEAGIAELNGEVAANANEIDELNGRLKRQTKRLAKLEVWNDWITRYAPDGPFNTLVYVIGFLLLGTLVKCSIRAVGDVAIARVAKRVAANLRMEFFRARLKNRGQQDTSIGNAAGRVAGNVGAIGVAIQTIFGRGRSRADEAGFLFGRRRDLQLASAVVLVGGDTSGCNLPVVAGTNDSPSQPEIV